MNSTRKNIGDVKFSINQLDWMLNYLRTDCYASREHVIVEIIVECDRQPECVQHLDVGDFYPDRPSPYLSFSNQDSGKSTEDDDNDPKEKVSISPGLVNLIDNYINNERIEHSDNGRKPLVTKKNGRITKDAIRVFLYRWAR